MLFQFEEWRFYGFGLLMGVRNLVRNGFRLGFKKTVGKITQPINSYCRFPEYSLMSRSIDEFISEDSSGSAVRVLDVGSPKTFGLFLALNRRVEICLTDISPLNIMEYRTMWDALREGATGRVSFCLADARQLPHADNYFDIIYSMSVVEHVEAPNGDVQAVQEMVRVLKPGGLLLLSVPFGTHYMEQSRTGLRGAVQHVSEVAPHFFQRVYDRRSFEMRILASSDALCCRRVETIWRRNLAIPMIWGSLGEDFRGAFGFLNPLLSVLLNQKAEGLAENLECQYGPTWSPSAVYGDAVLVAQKHPGKVSARASWGLKGIDC